MDTLDDLPNMDEYHRIRSFNTMLSSTIRVMNPTSPPEVHISPGDPVHDYIMRFILDKISTENGSSCFSLALLYSSSASA